MNAESAGLVSEIAQRLREAERILFITGAGLSADSGMPTYRGVGGLYNDRDTEDELPIEQALSGPVFQRAPQITWKYLFQIERACRGVEPNAGHRMIAGLARDKPDTWVLTQNIDALHYRAGSANLIEIHGRYSELYCLQCDWCDTVQDYSRLADLPVCPACGAGIRPQVVLFGEMLPEAALADYYREMQRGFDLVFSVGTSSQFPYIVEPVLQARVAGVPTVEINPGQTDISTLVDYRLELGAADALQQIQACYESGE